MSGVRRVGRVLRWALLSELAVYRGLARWLARRPDVPAGAVPLGYARLVTPVLALWIVASAAEVVVVDVVLPWDGLRVPLLVLGVWGVLWMVGMLGAYRTRPHLVLDDSLVVRGGLRLEVRVPLAAVTGAVPRERDLPSSLRTSYVDGDALLVGVSGRTNLQLTLDPPARLVTPHGEVTASGLGIWVDEPREAAARFRRRRSAPLP